MNAKPKLRSTPGTDWDELRLFLAVVRGGSLLAAAKQLDVAVSTVSRRIASLEERTGTVLLERRSDGAVATEAGRSLGALATRIELDMAATLRDVAVPDISLGAASLKGTVRISAGDGFTLAVTECIAQFAKRHPEVDFEFAVESRIADLHKREADIAIRTVHKQESSLVYSNLGTLTYALWGSMDYLRQHDTPKIVADLRRHRFIGFGTPLEKHPAMKWLKELGVTRIATRANTFRAQLLAAQNGLGLAALPKSSAQKLIEVLPQITPATLPLFFVSHPQALRRPQVRAFADLLIANVRKRLA